MPYVYTEVLNDSFQKISAYVYDPCHCGRPSVTFWECNGTLILTMAAILLALGVGILIGVRIHKPVIIDAKPEEKP